MELFRVPRKSRRKWRIAKSNPLIAHVDRVQPRLPQLLLTQHIVLSQREVKRARKLLVALGRAQDPASRTAAYLILSKLLEAQIRLGVASKIESSVARTSRAIAQSLSS